MGISQNNNNKKGIMHRLVLGISSMRSHDIFQPYSSCQVAKAYIMHGLILGKCGPSKSSFSVPNFCLFPGHQSFLIKEVYVLFLCVIL